jgi:hypothetical protein
MQIKIKCRWQRFPTFITSVLQLATELCFHYECYIEDNAKRWAKCENKELNTLLEWVKNRRGILKS